MFCGKCGGQVNDGVAFCPACGNAMNSAAAPAQQPAMPGMGMQQPAMQGMGMQQPTMQGAQQPNANYPPGYVPKKWIVTLLLCIFLTGIHRIYVGKVSTGIPLFGLWILAWGAFAIPILLIAMIGLVVWFFIDIIAIVKLKFTDSKGYLLQKG